MYMMYMQHTNKNTGPYIKMYKVSGRSVKKFQKFTYFYSSENKTVQLTIRNTLKIAPKMYRKLR